MRSFIVGENIDLNTVGSETEIDMSAQDVPFKANYSVVAAFFLEGPAGTSFDLEGREDSSSGWTVLAQVLAAAGPGTFYRNVTLTQEIRLTVVGTAGAGLTGACHLLNN